MRCQGWYFRFELDRGGGRVQRFVEAKRSGRGAWIPASGLPDDLLRAADATPDGQTGFEGRTVQQMREAFGCLIACRCQTLIDCHSWVERP